MDKSDTKRRYTNNSWMESSLCLVKSTIILEVFLAFIVDDCTVCVYLRTHTYIYGASGFQVYIVTGAWRCVWPMIMQRGKLCQWAIWSLNVCVVPAHEWLGSVNELPLYMYHASSHRSGGIITLLHMMTYYDLVYCVLATIQTTMWRVGLVVVVMGGRKGVESKGAFWENRRRSTI